MTPVRDSWRAAPPVAALAVASALVVALAGCGGGDGADAGDPAASTPAPTTDPAGPPRPQVGSWTALADLPTGRTELGATALDGVVYLAGGFVQGGGPRDFLRYDPAIDDWEELAPTPVPRHHAPLAAHDGTVYLVGGCDHTGSAFGVCPPTDTLFAYHVATDTWRPGPPLPVPVGAQAVATTTDGRIHVIGGVGDGGTVLDVTNEHQVFDTTTGTWETLPRPELAREHHAAAYLDGVVYVVGGRNGASGHELEGYDIAAGEWSRLADAPTTGRSGVAVVAFQGQLYFFGGENLGTGVFDEAERYDPETDTWEELTPMPVGRHGLGAGALEDGIVVVGGGPQVGLTFSRHTEIWRP